MERLTARNFRITFSKLAHPVLVGQGIWFPRVSSLLLRIAEDEAEQKERTARQERAELEKSTADH